jgi:ferredoxin-NADP reductase
MKLTLREVQQETSDVYSFIFEPVESLQWQAGQYLKYTLPHKNPDDRGVERDFTIAAPPYEEYPRITTRFSERSSSFKQALRKLGAGNTIEAEGPFGKFVVEDPARDYVFIAGGIGITPFRAIVLAMNYRCHAQPTAVKILYANRDNEFVFRKEGDLVVASNPDMSVRYFVDPDRITEDAIREEARSLNQPLYYISGPAPMVFSVSDMLKGMGIAEDRIKLDDFPGYED